jgi:hypothetical protein
MAMQDTSAQGSQGANRTAGFTDGEELSEIKDTLGRSARDLTTELKRERQRLMTDVTQSATAFANEKKSAAAEYLHVLGDAAQASCKVLEERGYGGSSKFLSRAVQSLHEVTDDFSAQEPTQIVDNAVRYARQNPAMFLGAALFAGFGLARMVRASQAAEDDSYGEDDEENDYEEESYEASADDDDAGYTDDIAEDIDDAT